MTGQSERGDQQRNEHVAKGEGEGAGREGGADRGDDAVASAQQLHRGCGAQQIHDDDERGGDEDDLLAAPAEQPCQQQPHTADDSDGREPADRDIACAHSCDLRRCPSVAGEGVAES